MRKPVHLVFVEEKNKTGVDHNKFYDMFERNGECHCLWGRRQDGYEFGKSGKLTIKSLHEWDKILNSKVAKGYEDKSDLYAELVTSEDVKTGESEYAAIENKKIASIVERLQKYAKEVIAKNYTVKAGQVTNKMIDETQAYLDELMVALNNNDLTRFNLGLKEIFKIIPRSMKRVDLNLAQVPNDMQKILAREQDLLDIMRGQVVSPVKGQKVTTVKGDKKTILEINGLILEEVTAEDVAVIKRKLGADAGLYKNAWRITNEKQKKAYDKYCKEQGILKRNTKLLWHGTRNENVWSIMKSGLVLRPTNAVITGKMFGYGIYFAPLARKSIGYTSLSGSYWAKGGSNSAFMILHEVAYGTPYDVYSFESRLNSFDYRKLRNTKADANCLHAHAGSMLRNDEIVVYKEEQVSPLFIVELGK